MASTTASRFRYITEENLGNFIDNEVSVKIVVATNIRAIRQASSIITQ